MLRGRSRSIWNGLFNGAVFEGKTKKDILTVANQDEESEIVPMKVVQEVWPMALACLGMELAPTDFSKSEANTKTAQCRFDKHALKCLLSFSMASLHDIARKLCDASNYSILFPKLQTSVWGGVIES